ncbi:hypothetical protein K438DRAFT_1766919 [Mycena galopus ATCC 62051]|nr:hypothetical protein K438DRAFT_1766919 [Mycena galopus ATCC 62051]
MPATEQTPGVQLIHSTQERATTGMGPGQWGVFLDDVADRKRIVGAIADVPNHFANETTQHRPSRTRDETRNRASQDGWGQACGHLTYAARIALLGSGGMNIEYPTPIEKSSFEIVQHFVHCGLCLAMLDNFKTPWEPLESRGKVEEFLSVWADNRSLALLAEGCWYPTDCTDLTPLDFRPYVWVEARRLHEQIIKDTSPTSACRFHANSLISIAYLDILTERSVAEMLANLHAAEDFGLGRVLLCRFVTAGLKLYCESATGRARNFYGV